MSGKKINKRTFFKSLGILAIAGFIFPWLKGKKDAQLDRSYPLAAKKDPNSVQRTRHLV